MISTDLYQYNRISGTGAGTTVVKASSGNLKGLVIGSNKEGTVTFYDNASGTSAASLVFAINNNAGSIPTSLNLNLRFKSGLVAVTGGTTDMTVLYN